MEIQLSWVKAEGTGYIFIECMPPSSTWKAVKKDLCKVFSPVVTNVHVATQIHSRFHLVNETSQKYIQQFTDLVIHSTGADPTSVTCQVTTFYS